MSPSNVCHVTDPFCYLKDLEERYFYFAGWLVILFPTSLSVQGPITGAESHLSS
jgi:hypothetical protein